MEDNSKTAVEVSTKNVITRTVQEMKEDGFMVGYD